MFVLGGLGIAFGKFAENDNQVDSAWEIKAPTLTSTGTISSSGNATVGNTLTVNNESILKKGSRVATVNTGGGTAGYFKVCTFKITGTYTNQDITMSVAQRGRSGSIFVRFNSTNGTDPTLNTIRKTGNINAYIYKSATSTWDLYVQKSESYDNLEVTEFHKGSYMNNVSVTWQNATVSSLPSGYTTAQFVENVTTSESVMEWSVGGYPVYCKQINFGAGPNNEAKTVNTSLTNSSIKIIRADVWGYRSTTQTWFSIGSARKDNGLAAGYYLDNGSITIESSADRSNLNIWVYIYYIKQAP